jgi:hypothetical protein
MRALYDDGGREDTGSRPYDDVENEHLPYSAVVTIALAVRAIMRTMYDVYRA